MEEYKVLTNLPEEDHFGEWEKADVKVFGKWFMAENAHPPLIILELLRRIPIIRSFLK